MAIDWNQYKAENFYKDEPVDKAENKGSGYVGLPRESQVENAISGRQDLLSRGIQNIRGEHLDSIAPDKEIGARALSGTIGGVQAVGGVLQRGEAAIANPALMLQTPEKLFESAIEQGKSAPAVLFDEFVKGIKGERIGEFGDVYRKPIKNALLSEAAGIAGGLTSLNALLAAKPMKFLNSKTNKKAIENLANENTQKLGRGIKAVGDGVKAEYAKIINPHKDISTKISAKDITDKIPVKFRDVLKKSLTRFGKASAETTSPILDATGKKIIKDLTVGQLDDLIDDMTREASSYVAETARATGKKPNVSALYKVLNNMRNAKLKYLPVETQNAIKEINPVYGNIVPKVNELMYKFGYNAATNTFNTANAGKVLSNKWEATLRSMVKEVAKLDPQISKYSKSVTTWGTSLSRKGLLSNVGVGAGLGSMLGSKLVNMGTKTFSGNRPTTAVSEVD